MKSNARACLFCLILCLPLLGGCHGTPAAGTLDQAPIIDGILAGDEWQSSLDASFPDGSALRLGYRDGRLYLGIETIPPEAFVVNVYLLRDGVIEILHSSAALGTATYKEDSQTWLRTRDFVWRCRDTSLSEASQSQRDTFLQHESWLASIAYMGDPGATEYLIEWDGRPLQLAITLIRVSQPDQLTAWPENLADAGILRTPGALPERLPFDPVTWASLSLNGDGSGLEIILAD